MEPSKPAEPIEAPKYSEPPRALMEALQAQLRAIVDKPLTPGSLLELEQTARLSRELLVVGKMPAKRPGYPGAIMSPMYLGDTSSYESSGAAPYATSPQSETFGVSVIREIVTKLPELMKPKEVVYRESAASLIDAITAAREAKMDDVVAKLKAKLDALLDEPEAAVPNYAGQVGGGGGLLVAKAKPISGSGTINVPTAPINGASATEEEQVHVVLP